MESGAAGIALLIYLALFVGWVVLVVYIGKYIAEQKGRDPVEGVALGCVLGPLGWLIEALLPSRESEPSPTAYGATTTAPPRTGSMPRPYTPPNRWSRGSADVGKPKPGTTMYVHPDSDYSSGTVAAEETLANARRTARFWTGRGKRLVEAVWQDSSYMRLGLAFGDPGVEYARTWPTGEDVKDSIVIPEPEPEPEPQPQSDPPVQSSVPMTTDTRTSAAASPATGLPASEPDNRSTKACPDCAETVLEAARICRFCRYEFRPPGPTA